MTDFLTDGTVSLRPITKEDLPQLADWRNDPDLRVRTREWRPLTMVDQERWFSRISSPETHDFMFVITTATTDNTHAAVGVGGLCHWAPRDRTAEISIYIGAREYRNRGLAGRAFDILHRYGFEELALDRIWAEVYSFNDPVLKLLDRAGYQREGVLRQHVFRNGQRIDAVMFGLLRPEWKIICQK